MYKRQALEKILDALFIDFGIGVERNNLRVLGRTINNVGRYGMLFPAFIIAELYVDSTITQTLMLSGVCLSLIHIFRKLAKDAKQAEKAVKGLQTMIRRLEAQIFRSQSQLEEIEKSLVSGKIALQEYEIQKTRIQKQISEYQSKLEDKACKLQEKEQELEKMTKNIDRVGRVAQPFRNHKIDFEPPRITGKPPIFGVDKWIEEQNRSCLLYTSKQYRRNEGSVALPARREIYFRGCCHCR